MASSDVARAAGFVLSRVRRLAAWRTPQIVVIACCVEAFLLIVAFGEPPRALGLDPSWTEVLAWGFLHQVQWGRDLIFTYGPLGFLQPYGSYVSGIFPWFVAGQIVLPAAFALSVGLMLQRCTISDFSLFLVALVICCSRLTGDVSWALTPLFASTFLINCTRQESEWKLVVLALPFAPIFAAIALIKFSLFPLWALCVVALTAVALARGNIRAAGLVLLTFVGALFLVWFACGQPVQNVLLFLSAGFEIARGYRQAMGVRPPLWADLCAFVILAAFVSLCIVCAWRKRDDRTALASAALAAAAAVLLWMAFLTRGDDSHWPGFFAAMSFLPFVLLCNRHFIRDHRVSMALAAITATCALLVNADTSPAAVARHIAGRTGGSVQALTHLSDLHDLREAEWVSAAASIDLPRIRGRIGASRVDMVTWEQGVVLLNHFNYAPRPVFQSYSAYTPRLARLNEAYFLGADAPPFVVFRLDSSDNKVPMSEDGLALLALLKVYRPALSEREFLLLQREGGTAADVTALVPDGQKETAIVGAETPIRTTAAPTIAFIDVELTVIGRIYTALFREAELDIDLNTDDGQRFRYRFTRPSAPAGFLLNPLVRSTQDWIRLYFSKALPRIRSIRIDAQSGWERLLFQPTFSLAFERLDMLHADSSSNVSEFAGMLFPGFNIAPSSPDSVRLVDEDGRQAVFLHAPASLFFALEPGNYRISAIYGIQGAALSDPNCIKDGADGIGVSLVLNHAGASSVVAHADTDPFHTPRDRGPQALRLASVDIAPGDVLEYRVDAGPGGRNTSCDWSYVRDFVLERHGGRRATAPADRIFTDALD